MSKYPDVVQQLVSAAVDQGLAALRQVYAIADGGKELWEILEAQFPNLTFILARSHFKQHIYETAEVIGLKDLSVTTCSGFSYFNTKPKLVIGVTNFTYQSALVL